MNDEQLDRRHLANLEAENKILRKKSTLYVAREKEVACLKEKVRNLMLALRLERAKRVALMRDWGYINEEITRATGLDESNIARELNFLRQSQKD